MAEQPPRRPEAIPQRVRRPGEVTGRQPLHRPQPGEVPRSWFGRFARRAGQAKGIIAYSIALAGAVTGFLVYFAPRRQVDAQTTWLQAHESRIIKVEEKQTYQQVEIENGHRDLHWLVEQTYRDARSRGVWAPPPPTHTPLPDGGTP